MFVCCPTFCLALVLTEMVAAKENLARMLTPLRSKAVRSSLPCHQRP